AVAALTVHLICADGWSMSVLFAETARLYQAFSEGRASPLPPLPIQYADFAIWQRETLPGTLQPQRAFWTRELAGLPPPRLPTDHAGPSVPTYRGARHRFMVAPSLASRLQELSARHGVTIFVTGLAAFQ